MPTPTRCEASLGNDTHRKALYTGTLSSDISFYHQNMIPRGLPARAPNNAMPVECGVLLASIKGRMRFLFLLYTTSILTIISKHGKIGLVEDVQKWPQYCVCIYVCVCMYVVCKYYVCMYIHCIYHICIYVSRYLIWHHLRHSQKCCNRLHK